MKILTKGPRTMTKFGLDYYNVMEEQYNLISGKYSSEKDSWLKYIIEERDSTDLQLKEFLESDDVAKIHKMDETDKDGWNYVNEMADKSSILTYFTKRK